jgi:glucose-6-phosphate dehydrogenase assembly protein OpcA
MSEAVWSAQDTTPAAIDAALRKLLAERHAENEAYVPARVLNLVVIVDRQWRGEIENRLERVGRYHPSRTVVCAVEPGRDTIDAWATLSAEDDPKPGMAAATRERVEIEIGPHQVEHLDRVVDPVLVRDLSTVVWAPHGHREAVRALLDLAHVVLLDSLEEHDLRDALDWVGSLAEHAYVVDLAWLRSTPWRERVAATFDPPQWRGELSSISAVEVRHRPDSRIAAVLFVGWLASRLGWEASALTSGNGAMRGRARGRRQEVEVRLEPVSDMTVPGLAGVTIGTASGVTIQLDRGPGGLTAKRCDRHDCTSEWTVLGASRGEGGILGEGVRQALLRDPTYGGALHVAAALVG